MTYKIRTNVLYYVLQDKNQLPMNDEGCKIEKTSRRSSQRLEVWWIMCTIFVTYNLTYSKADFQF